MPPHTLTAAPPPSASTDCVAPLEAAALAAQLGDALLRLDAVGATPVAMYGGGPEALAAMEALGARARGVELFIRDDGASGGRALGRPIVTPEEAVARGIRGVVICAPPGALEEALRMWSRRRVFRKAGIDIRAVPPILESKHWDESLIAHEDLRRARLRGRDIPYDFAWPRADHTTWSALLDPLLERAPGAGADMLEIGPGSGTYSEHLLPRARAFTAVDFSRRLLEEVFERRFAHRLDDLRLVHDESALLPGVADESIDFAFSVDCFVHVKIDVAHRWLLSLARVLRPGGAAMIHFKDWTQDEIARWERTDRAAAVYRTTHFTHPDMLRRSAERAGLAFEPGPRALSSFYAVFTKPPR